MNFLKDKDVVLVNVLRNSTCGHLFECIEYYYLFKSEYVSDLGRNVRPSIYLAYDNFTKEDLKNVLINKYTLTDKEIDNLLEDTYIESIGSFCDRKIQDFRDAKSTVFVEAYDLVQMSKLGMIIAANNPIGLRCAQADDEFGELKGNYKKFKIFQDYRVYGETLHDFKTRNHVKKLLFNKLKLYKSRELNSAFMYLSTDCRDLPSDYVESVIKLYPSFEKIYVAVLNKEPFKHLESEKVKFLVPPIENFHGIFDTMIYLPVARKFDCSSRLIPECAFYYKKVFYHDIDYKDLGMEIRRADVHLKGYMSLQLTRNDRLFEEIVKQCLK